MLRRVMKRRSWLFGLLVFAGLIGNAQAFIPQLRRLGFTSFEVIEMSNLDLTTPDFKKAAGAGKTLAPGAGHVDCKTCDHTRASTDERTIDHAGSTVCRLERSPSCARARAQHAPARHAEEHCHVACARRRSGMGRRRRATRSATPA